VVLNVLEIIKAIIDPIAKSLSLPALLEARKNRKAHELGTELFLLYASLNDVLVLGRDIVAELERVCARMEQKFRGGRPNEGCSSRLEFLLRQQSLSILKLVGSIKRLHLVLQVISPDTFVKIHPLLEGKRNAVDGLLDYIVTRKLVSVDPDHLRALLDDVGHRSNSLDRLFMVEPIDNVGVLIAKQYPIIRGYLENRKPATALDDIERVAKGLREALEENFSIREILLNVGDQRAAIHNPYVA
jgi:hypothetical protein